jgi:hypothetical protein
MKKAILLLILADLLTSCAIQKRANHALKRIGADPLLLAIQEKFPDKFHQDTARRTITITKIDTFKVVTTESVVDTFLQRVQDTCRFNYEDKNVVIYLDGKRFRYSIKRKIETVVMPNTTSVKCPECPPIPKQVKEPIVNKKNYAYLWIILSLITFCLGLFLGVKYAKK